MKIKDFKEKYRIQRHPLKAEFKKLKISNGELANYLKISPVRANQFLNSVTSTPPEIEQKMQKLVKELRE